MSSEDSTRDDYPAAAPEGHLDAEIERELDDSIADLAAPSAKSDGSPSPADIAAGLDDEIQREIDEALGDMSIEDVLAAEEAAQGRGDEESPVRKGTVVAVQDDALLVDLGGRSEGMLPASQFDDETMPEVGDVVEVTIEGYDESEGLILLSRKGAVLAATWDTLEKGSIVEARVTGHNKGGLEVSIDGIRGFMPISQIEMYRVEDLAGYLHHKLTCEVIEIDRSGDNVVVSRREVLEREAAEQREMQFKELQVGQIVPGVVRSIMPYGAFVGIGAVDGLLHISDMSHSRIEDPTEIVTEGQQVQVKILKISEEDGRISLGLKQVQPDPWDGAAAKWPADHVVSGRVVRLADFGAFVELEPGVDGLIPISEFSFERRIHHPSEMIAVGDVIKVRVLKLDVEAKRISLSLKRVGDDPWIGASVRWPVDSIAEGVVTRLADFGAFVELAPGVEALVHISEAASGHVRSIAEAVREGQTVQAKVLSVDEDSRRISLSIKQVQDTPWYTGPEGDPPAAEEPKKRKRPLKGGLD